MCRRILLNIAVDHQRPLLAELCPCGLSFSVRREHDVAFCLVAVLMCRKQKAIKSFTVSLHCSCSVWCRLGYMYIHVHTCAAWLPWICCIGFDVKLYIHVRWVTLYMYTIIHVHVGQDVHVIASSFVRSQCCDVDHVVLLTWLMIMSLLSSSEGAIQICGANLQTDEFA